MTEPERLRWIYSFWALSMATGELNDWASLRAEGVSLALDLAVAAAYPSSPNQQQLDIWADPRRLQIRRADQLHAVKMAGVAW